MLLHFLLFAGLSLAMVAQAEPSQSASKVECNLIFSKIPCWQDYIVFVDMIDAATQETIQSFQLEKKKLSITVPYDCQKHSQINFRAHFAPSIWQDDEKKVYTSSKVWDVASEVAALAAEPNNATTTSFTLKATFPDNFSEVPSPAICDKGKALPKVPTH